MDENNSEIRIDLSVIEQIEEMMMFGDNGNGKKCCNGPSKEQEFANTGAE